MIEAYSVLSKKLPCIPVCFKPSPVNVHYLSVIRAVSCEELFTGPIGPAKPAEATDGL